MPRKTLIQENAALRQENAEERAYSRELEAKLLRAYDRLVPLLERENAELGRTLEEEHELSHRRGESGQAGGLDAADGSRPLGALRLSEVEVGERSG